jgi:aminoglycoside phosphotransferase (APT) family kinase protein
MEEIPLQGGRTTAGVVTVGNTIRRPLTTNSGFVHGVLRHLASVGFDRVPRVLGIDEHQREILTYVPGEVPAELEVWADRQLAMAAHLIKQFHDATVAFAAAHGAEVVCHNDLSPCNFVFRQDVPSAIIDFDAAALGTRLDDLGYAAWLWLDLGNTHIAPQEQQRRLALFTAAYGLPDTRLLIASILRRQHHLIADGRRKGNASMRAWAERCLAWTMHHLHYGYF